MIRKPSGREAFLSQLKAYMLEDELEQVYTAYVFAKYGHRGQLRAEGIRYFEHPKTVANMIIRELSIRNNWRLIVTALLHDISEDTWILSERRIEINFGRDVAWWVKLLTKEAGVDYYTRLRKAAPWQALLVKFCDRLHNLRTLVACDAAKQKRKLAETRKYFPQLAEILLARIPSEYRSGALYVTGAVANFCAERTPKSGKK